MFKGEIAKSRSPESAAKREKIEDRKAKQLLRASIGLAARPMIIDARRKKTLEAARAVRRVQDGESPEVVVLILGAGQTAMYGWLRYPRGQA